MFTTPRPFDERELRRLAPAVTFHRSMIGICATAAGSLQIWGVVHSGTRWLQTVYGGSERFVPFPNALIVHVTGPGRITTSCGLIMLAALRGGRLITAVKEVFSSAWLEEWFADTRSELLKLHEEARERYGEQWGLLDPTLFS